jgi:hypothetical protein
MTNSFEELREGMTLDVEMGNVEIEDRFEVIAKLLFEKTAVKTSDKIYLFKEIEFYFYYCNHKDIITHPRNSNALYWQRNREISG